MIRDVEVLKDGAGLPIVSWREGRGLHSPEALRLARVECRIMKDKKDGALLFAARGTVREGSFEEAKPWAQLTGFDCKPAHALYNSATDLFLRQKALGKSPTGAIALHDGAQVVLTLFGPTELPIHINCADASPVELQKLQATLRRAFLEQRDHLIFKHCGNVFRWPRDDDRVVTYDPLSARWLSTHRVGETTRLIDFAAWALALMIGVGIFGTLYWLL